MSAFLLCLDSSKEKLELLKQCVNFFWEQKKRLGAICKDEKSKNFIEDFFWKFPKNSFIPTAFVDSSTPASTCLEPLLLSYENKPEFEACFFFSFTEAALFNENRYLIYLVNDSSEQEKAENFLKEKGVASYSFNSSQDLLEGLNNHIF
ncbi:hypothetical protein AB751O23_BB_00020 [Chlamydiales bacterium SCGC AB-751-O23]|nr:hypothetical protein AB751O23_BB_00020 [Chlamydiales bacterium SCGC AB-751-O23]